MVTTDVSRVKFKSKLDQLAKLVIYDVNLSYVEELVIFFKSCIFLFRF